LLLAAAGRAASAMARGAAGGVNKVGRRRGAVIAGVMAAGCAGARTRRAWVVGETDCRSATAGFAVHL